MKVCGPTTDCSQSSSIHPGAAAAPDVLSLFLQAEDKNNSKPPTHFWKPSPHRHPRMVLGFGTLGTLHTHLAEGGACGRGVAQFAPGSQLLGWIQAVPRSSCMEAAGQPAPEMLHLWVGSGQLAQQLSNPGLGSG